MHNLHLELSSILEECMLANHLSGTEVDEIRTVRQGRTYVLWGKEAVLQRCSFQLASFEKERGKDMLKSDS